MNVEYYPGTQLKVEFIDGQVMIGEVFTFESSDNTDTGLDELIFVPESGKLKGRHVVFNESEVKNIEVLD
ncbi:hypothetical protein [Allofustis seminis]|uniref:hypothetical protein n=1 Tax=Allofustis seminis TaxID=166939 RepID=UPI00037F271C|nr:hypothetical protein [Allofustis seminis]